MKNLIVLAITTIVLLTSCGESKETRIQRYLLQGNDMAKKHNYDEAEDFYKQVLKRDSCHADAWNNLGTLYFNQKKYTLALAQYNHALARRKQYTDAYFNRANTFYELHEYYSALDDVSKVVEKKPDTVVVFFLQGLIYSKLRQFDKAIQYFNEARRRDVKNAEVLIN